MIDLHVHLDGSLSARTVIELANMQKIKLPFYEQAALLPFLKAPEDCKSLDTYLKCFQIPLSVLQSNESIEYAVCSLCTSLKQQGLLYAEIRFAPQLHTKNGCTQAEIVKAALRGVALSGFHARLILCAMRGLDNEQQNMQTVHVAEHFINQGVVAVDLAGAEGRYPTSLFDYLFTAARERNIPFTVHAGEAAGVDSVRFAVEAGASRIGHGIHAAQSPELVDIIKKREIAIEMCPTSNFQTGAVTQAEAYPLMQWLESGIKVTVNTDNMTISDTCIRDEIHFLEFIYGLSDIQQNLLWMNAVDAAFLSNLDKEKLRMQIFK